MDAVAVGLMGLCGVTLVVIFWDMRARRRRDERIFGELAVVRADVATVVGARTLEHVIEAAAATCTAAAATKHAPLPPIERKLALVTRDDDPVHMRATVPEGTPAALLEDGEEEELTVVTTAGRLAGVRPAAPSNDRQARSAMRPPPLVADRESPEPA